MPLALVILFGCAVICAWTDLRTRRIPNLVVIPAIVIALMAGYQEFGWQVGLKPALQGVGLALLVMIPGYRLRAFGAGDAKLMMLVGAAAGPEALLIIFGIAVVLSALAGVTMAIIKRRFKVLASNMQIGVMSLAARDFDSMTWVSKETAYRVPFAVAVLIALPIWLKYFST